MLKVRIFSLLMLGFIIAYAAHQLDLIAIAFFDSMHPMAINLIAVPLVILLMRMKRETLRQERSQGPDYDPYDLQFEFAGRRFRYNAINALRPTLIGTLKWMPAILLSFVVLVIVFTDFVNTNIEGVASFIVIIMLLIHARQVYLVAY